MLVYMQTCVKILYLSNSLFCTLFLNREGLGGPGSCFTKAVGYSYMKVHKEKRKCRPDLRLYTQDLIRNKEKAIKSFVFTVDR
jgi:hypothetical protein